MIINDGIVLQQKKRRRWVLSRVVFFCCSTCREGIHKIEDGVVRRGGSYFTVSQEKTSYAFGPSFRKGNDTAWLGIKFNLGISMVRVENPGKESLDSPAKKNEVIRTLVDFQFSLATTTLDLKFFPLWNNVIDFKIGRPQFAIKY